MFTSHLAGVYLEHFGMQPSMGIAESIRDENAEFVLKKLWVNYQKKYDFNPIHIHSGVFSFVIWVQIPYDLTEERKRYNLKGDETAAFTFNITMHWVDWIQNILILIRVLNGRWHSSLHEVKSWRESILYI